MPDPITSLSLWQNYHLPSHPVFSLFYWIDLMPYLLFDHFCWLFYERILLHRTNIWLVRPDLKALCLPDGFFSGCSSSAVPSLWRRTCGWCCMTTTCWPKTKRLERQWLTWRIASCPNMEPCVACRSPTVCKLRQTEISNFHFRYYFSNSVLLPVSLSTLLFVISHPSVPEWTSGGINWHPGSCCSECVSDGTCQCLSTRATRSTLEETCTLLPTSVRDTHVNHAGKYSAVWEPTTLRHWICDRFTWMLCAVFSYQRSKCIKNSNYYCFLTTVCMCL